MARTCIRGHVRLQHRTLRRSDDMDRRTVGWSWLGLSHVGADLLELAHDVIEPRAAACKMATMRHDDAAAPAAGGDGADVNGFAGHLRLVTARDPVLDFVGLRQRSRADTERGSFADEAV